MSKENQTNRGDAEPSAKGVPPCARCKSRPARTDVDSFEIRDGLEHVHWCTPCRAAHRIVFTSVDEAVRHHIKGETDAQVLNEALILEQTRGGSRVTVVKALDRRLRAIAKGSTEKTAALRDYARRNGGAK